MAIFDDTSSLRHYYIDNNIYDYRQLVEDFDIDIVYRDDLPKNYLGLAVPATRTIFLKNNITGIGQEFIEAHEINHILLGRIPAPFYDSCYVSNRKVEMTATYGAIFMLLRFYVNCWGIDKAVFNTTHFLRHFKIPDMYYFQVESFVEQYSAEIFA